eukprot:4592202-Pyramimonas_sp.AAC.1
MNNKTCPNVPKRSSAWSIRMGLVLVSYKARTGLWRMVRRVGSRRPSTSARTRSFGCSKVLSKCVTTASALAIARCFVLKASTCRLVSVPCGPRRGGLGRFREAVYGGLWRFMEVYGGLWRRFREERGRDKKAGEGLLGGGDARSTTRASCHSNKRGTRRVSRARAYSLFTW